MTLLTHEQMAAAIEWSGFSVGPTLHGNITLWCIECGRDSGFHWADCSKHRRADGNAFEALEERVQDIAKKLDELQARYERHDHGDCYDADSVAGRTAPKRIIIDSPKE